VVAAGHDLVQKLRSCTSEVEAEPIERRLRERIPNRMNADGIDTPLEQIILGDAYHRMMADHVAWPKIKFAGTTALIWATHGDEAAEHYWASGGRPEASRPDNRAARRASTTTATAGSTTPPNSTSGTNPRPTSSSRRRRGRRSTGRRS
jgi:hypothetical protein